MNQAPTKGGFICTNKKEGQATVLSSLSPFYYFFLRISTNAARLFGLSISARAETASALTL